MRNAENKTLRYGVGYYLGGPITVILQQKKIDKKKKGKTRKYTIRQDVGRLALFRQVVESQRQLLKCIHLHMQSIPFQSLYAIISEIISGYRKVYKKGVSNQSQLYFEEETFSCGRRNFILSEIASENVTVVSLDGTARVWISLSFCVFYLFTSSLLFRFPLYTNRTLREKELRLHNVQNG